MILRINKSLYDISGWIKTTLFLIFINLLIVIPAFSVNNYIPKESDKEMPLLEKILTDPRNIRYWETWGNRWFPVPGSKIKIRFRGFTQINYIRNFQQIGFPFGQFIPSQITVPTDNTGDTQFDPRTSRLIFETRAKASNGNINSFVSVDLSGLAQEDSIQARLRQAYILWISENKRDSILAGQANTTFKDILAWPEIFDLEGPNAMTGGRQVMLRYTLKFYRKFGGAIAIENPRSVIEGGNGLSDLPDAVVRINWYDKWGHFMLAGLARQLIGERINNTGRDVAFAWGLSLSGKLKLLPSKDNFQFQIVGGAGTGRYIFDFLSAPTNNDGVYDATTATLTPLRVIGGFGSYQHWWTKNKLRSTFIGGYLFEFNLTIQPEDSFHETIYLLGNLIYRMWSHLDAGVEYYYGRLEQKSGQQGYVNRLMFSINLGL